MTLFSLHRSPAPRLATRSPVRARAAVRSSFAYEYTFIDFLNTICVHSNAHMFFVCLVLLFSPGNFKLFVTVTPAIRLCNCNLHGLHRDFAFHRHCPELKGAHACTAAAVRWLHAANFQLFAPCARAPTISKNSVCRYQLDLVVGHWPSHCIIFETK